MYTLEDESSVLNFINAYEVMLLTSTLETTAKLLNRGYRYHELRKAFSKF